jgi:peptidoglycan/xylan/chitin deacetylase (PgdA/CDA1 family)
MIARLVLGLFLWMTWLHAGAEVVLLRSDTTRAFFHAHGADYEKLAAPWRAFFARRSIAMRELPAEQLAGLARPGVLVLASAVALADDERKAIAASLAAGWSVLGTWAVGVRDGRGEWSGYGFVEQVFGAEVLPDLAPGKDESFLLPYGETPLTHALPAGKRIYLLRNGEPFLRVRARNGAARFGAWMRDATGAGALLSAAAFHEHAGARRAFFGFTETAWSSAQADVDALLAGTLDWLSRRPIVVKSAWPHPHQAALLLEMDTEDKFENSVRFAELLERHGVRGTFYSLTSEGLKFPAVVKRLASRHEMAYHAEVHVGFAKLGRGEQDARLREMVQHMSRLIPDVSRATGFRAPLEQYDATTEKLLRARGLRHHAASPSARDDVLPGFSTAEPDVPTDDALVVLPRTWLDDINLFSAGLLKAQPAEKMLLASLEDTVAMRGFGLLSLHTQNFYAGSALERATPVLLKGVARHGKAVWTAPGEAIAKWWRDRAAVDVDVQETAGGVVVRLTARRPVQRLRLVLMPPGDAPPQLAGAGTARLEKLDAHRWAIVLPGLEKGQSELRVVF